jgi:rhodanese-related sulfurtransferase
VNLPMSRIGDLLHELPDGEFDVICAVGGRSGRVVEALEARGYAATNVEGGTNGWVQAGFPVER